MRVNEVRLKGMNAGLSRGIQVVTDGAYIGAGCSALEVPAAKVSSVIESTSTAPVVSSATAIVVVLAILVALIVSLLAVLVELVRDETTGKETAAETEHASSHSAHAAAAAELRYGVKEE